MEIVAVLDNIRSVHNVGSIFRTSDAAGVHTLYLCGVTPTPLDRFGKVRKDFAKVSLGAEQTLLWKAKRSTALVLRALKKEGYTIVAVEQADGSKPYFALRKKYKKVALVIGNEVTGLSRAILARADVVAEIPMHGKKESLNVSVAFGIAVYGIQY